MVALWNADADLIIRGMDIDAGRYINRRDAEGAGITSLTVRYGRDRKVAVIRATGGVWK